MKKIRYAVLTALSAAGMLAAASASAASLQFWNGSAWTNAGTVTLKGPTTATYVGLGAPCTATFVLTLASGVAKVTSASFAGSSTCTGITTNITATNPWPIAAPVAYTGANPPFTGAPTLTSTIHNLVISNIRVTIPAPLNANCPSPSGTGSITGQLDRTNFPNTPAPTRVGTPAPGYFNRFVFRGALGPCTVQTRPTTDSTAAAGYFALTPDKAIRVVP